MIRVQKPTLQIPRSNSKGTEANVTDTRVQWQGYRSPCYRYKGPMVRVQKPMLQIPGPNGKGIEANVTDTRVQW